MSDCKRRPSGAQEILDDGSATILPSPARVQWDYIQMVLRDCKGNVSLTARRLHMHRRTLQRRLAKLAPDV